MVILDELYPGQIVYYDNVHDGWGVVIKVIRNPEKIKLRKDEELNLDTVKVLCYSKLNRKMVTRYLRPEQLRLEFYDLK